MLRLFLLLIALLAVAMLLLSVRVLTGKRFIHTHVSGNKEMRRRGIGCAQSQDAIICRPRRTAVRERRN